MKSRALLLSASLTHAHLAGVFDFHQGLPVEEQHDEPTGADIFEELWNTILNVYGMLLGNVPLDSFAAMDYRFVYQLMFLLFVYIQTILFMNLIIAMMGESFEKVLQAAQRELTTDRAELLIRVELTMGVQKMRSMGYLPRYLHVSHAPDRALPLPSSSGTHGDLLAENSGLLFARILIFCAVYVGRLTGPAAQDGA